MDKSELNRLKELAEKADKEEVVAWLPDKGFENQARYINAANPQTILALIAEVGRLNKEADWLAGVCKDFCASHNYCAECALHPVGCPERKKIKLRFSKHEVENWREAARKAMEQDNG